MKQSSRSNRVKAVFQHHLSLGTLFVLVLSFLFTGIPASAHAQEPEDQHALQQRMEQLEKTLAAIQAQLSALQGKVAAQPAATPAPSAVAAQETQQQAPAPTTTAQQTKRAPATNPGSTTPSSSGVYPAEVANQTIGEHQPTRAEQEAHRWFERKPGRDLSFYTHGGEITAYGNLDISVDTVTKGLNGLTSGGMRPVGNVGWLEDLSTNLSFLGVRGTQSTGFDNLNFVYQLETQIELTAAPGIQQSNSEEQNTVQGTLFTRNTYIGLGSKRLGAFLFGKTDAPYKQSTARLNPFVGMEGDNSVIMGNTGGDNRVEFGTRLDHSLWYVSPNMHGFEANVLFSPGQNRANDSDNIAAGEVACTGGDNPGDGGDQPDACNDGGFSDAVSASVSYTNEPLYITVAYERHMKVNRQSDLTAMYAGTTFANTDSFGVPNGFLAAEVADEDAAKVGIQYSFFKQRRTVVSAEVESFHRYVPYFLEFQNERQRLGSWFALTQGIGTSDSFSIGWAQAYRTPGDPGQHNTTLAPAPIDEAGDLSNIPLSGGRGVNNKAALYTAVYRHSIGDGLTVYSNYAMTLNDQYAHYDLGAGGHGIKTDAHDAFDAVGNEFSDPHLWAGGHLKGLSLGLNKRF